MSRIGRAFTLGIFLMAALTMVGQLQARTLFVNKSAEAGGNGQSWVSAHQKLQDALDQTVEGDEVWIAAGTYYPDEGATVIPGDRTMTFTLKEGVSLYGGFDGTESSTSQRDLESNETILSGEIWEDQLYYSLHVVTLAGSASMDGVTVTKGNANGDAAPFNQGGGVMVGSNSLEIDDCTFSGNSANKGGAIYSRTPSSSYGSISVVAARNCTFIGNSANDGGAVYSYPYYGESSLTASNCTFSGNNATSKGGAIYSKLISSTASFIVSDCTFSGNGAYKGGAVYSESQHAPVTLRDCTFSGNSASYDGGAFYSSTYSITSVTVSDCTFSGNSAGYNGGGVYAPESMTISNSTFSGNSAKYGGAGYYSASSVTVNNCMFFLNRAINGGAVYCFNSYNSVTVSNCTFWKNSCENSTGKGRVIYSSGAVKLFNNIIDDDDALGETPRIYLTSTASLRNADSDFPSPLDQAKNFIKGGLSSITPEEGAVTSLGDTSTLILSGDPGFLDGANPIGDDGIWGTSDDGMRLSQGSMAIEQGLTRYLPQDVGDVDQDGDVDEIIPVDLAGYVRVQGTTVDLGAYETGGNSGPINFITAPASQVVLRGHAAIFEVIAAGYSLSYQWYEGLSGDTSRPIDGAQWKSFDTGNLNTSKSYWVRVYNSVTHLDSLTVAASVVPLMITQQPQDTLTSPGGVARLSVTAEGDLLTYQWYEGESGDNSKPVSGAISDSLVTAELSVSTHFWVEVSNSQGSVSSIEATVTVGGGSLGAALYTNTPLLYTSSGDESWYVQSTNTHDGESAVQSGAIGDSQTSVLETTVDGPGTISFWWKASTLESGDRGRFYIDGSYEAYIYRSSSNWVLKTYTITGSGGHTLKWTYTKNSSGSGGDDCIWLDDVTWTPQLITKQPVNTSTPLGLSARLNVETDADNLTYQWYEGERGDNSKPVIGATLPDFVTANLDGDRTYWVEVGNGEAYEASNTITVTVVPDLPQLAAAVGASAGIKLYTWGDSPWSVQDSVVQSEDSALESGAITHDQSSVLEAVVEGEGDLSFWWKASSELGYDILSLLIDGVEYDLLSGEEDWQQVSIAVRGSGMHRITWEFSKDDSKTAGTDQAWVDTLVWTASDANGIPYESWASSHSLSGDDAMESANPSGDGMSNLMKYALRLDPHEVVSTQTDGVIPGKPAIMNSDEGMKFVFLRNAEARDLTYTVESCDDMASWTAVTIGVTETVLSETLVKVEVVMPPGGSCFCRLVVSK